MFPVALSKKENGFTLIELMVAIVIVASLAGIAIRQLSVYQARAFDARAERDLRAAVTAEEAYFSDNEAYAQCQNSECEVELHNFNQSDGTRISVTAADSGTSFEAEAYHPKGERRFFYSSETGHLSIL